MIQPPPGSGGMAGSLQSWRDALPAWIRNRLPRRLPVWRHADYRLPVPELAAIHGIEPNRADLALWALLGAGNRRHLAVHEAGRIAYGHLGLVHTPAWLEALTRPDRLAEVYGITGVPHFPVDAVMHSVRLACGGTLAAARHVVAHRGPALNLLGGFHHAFPHKGGGLCPVNDLAVAAAVLRSEGFTGRIAVLDLDAHPPDGTAACLRHDPNVWIGSLSGSDWGPLDGVDETVLPEADDPTYLHALRGLLRRMPPADLVFVLAGADVLEGDRLGALRLTHDGARIRDERVAAHLGDTPAVWVPAGGYRADAWRVLASTAVTLNAPRTHPVPRGLDPVENRFAYVSRSLDPRELTGEVEDEPWFTEADLDPRLGGDHPPRLLDYYTEEGIEYALHAYGLLAQIRRLGYGAFRVRILREPTGDRARLTGVADGRTHLLWEVQLDRERHAGRPLLALRWMTMRHPLGGFPPGRPPLPGQEVPGLGLATEAVRLLERVALRLGLDGIVYRPAWFHTARMAIPPFQFEDLEEHARFEALTRDLAPRPWSESSRLVADRKVLLDGRPWTWPAAPMVHLLTPEPHDPAVVARLRDTHRFTILGASADPSGPSA